MALMPSRMILWSSTSRTLVAISLIRRTTEVDNCILFTGAIHGEGDIVPARVIAHEENRQAPFFLEIDNCVHADLQNEVVAAPLQLNIEMRACRVFISEFNHRFRAP